MQELTDFLKNQKILQIAPHAGDPWIANVYMACSTPGALYFIGNKNRRYGRQLQKAAELAFAAAWHNPSNFRDRKGIQGVGVVEVVTDQDKITEGIEIYHAVYDDVTDRITPEWVTTNKDGGCLYKITPTYIKFWNDELYGPEGTKEFTF